MFQLIYLDFTAPRLDTAAFQALKNQVGPYLANRGADPDEVFGDTVQVTMSQHNFRARPLTAATFAEVNPEKAFAFYKDRFADASDFTFVFVGNVDTLTLKPLVEKYLASLPSIGSEGDVPRQRRLAAEGRRRARGAQGRRAEGEHDHRLHRRVPVRAGDALRDARDDRAVPDQAQRVAARAARRRVQPERRRRLRRVPRQEYSIQVQFNSSPENVEKLSKSVFALIDSLKTQGPTAGRRGQGEGGAHARPRGRGQAEQLLARQHHGAGRSRARTSRACSARTTR